MAKVLQISLDIVVGPRCDGMELAESVSEELSKRGYTIKSAYFVGNMTAYYNALDDRYLMEIERHFLGKETFIVKAKNEADALDKARERIKEDPYYRFGSLRCVKKLKG